MRTTHRLMMLALGAMVALGVPWGMQAQAQEAPNGNAADALVEIDTAEVTPHKPGDTREDLVFTPISCACRMADTRIVGGPVAAGAVAISRASATSHSKGEPRPAVCPPMRLRS